MTADACCAACASTSGCAAAVWGDEPSNEACYLKGSLQGLHKSGAGLVLLNHTSTPSAKGGCVVEGGVDCYVDTPQRILVNGSVHDNTPVLAYRQGRCCHSALSFAVIYIQRNSRCESERRDRVRWQ
jgi:hypothetical protein